MACALTNIKEAKVKTKELRGIYIYFNSLDLTQPLIILTFLQIIIKN